MIRKNIYQWHRVSSLIIALPVTLWALSGVLHPVMTTIRPRVATQYLVPDTINNSSISVSLEDALKKNHVDSFRQFRFIHIDTNWFYQVQKAVGAPPVYLSTRTGKKLANGDALYARYLAKLFLEGQLKPPARPVLYASLQSTVPATPDTHDCCDAATSCVLNNEKGSQVTRVSRVESFTGEYKFVNRLLPVYRVDFDRSDAIRVYVETTFDRFAFAMDDKRALFDRLFGFFHTWEWMNALGKTKYVLMVLLTGLAFATTLMGLYIFFSTKAKKPNGNPVIKARRLHRWVSVSISLFTLMFTGSGALHAFSKLLPDEPARPDTGYFSSAIAGMDIKKLQASLKNQQLINVSLVQMEGQQYWQVFARQRQHPAPLLPSGDLMKPASIATPAMSYIRTADYTLLENGDRKYAGWLASLSGKQALSAIVQTTPVVKFGDEYGFVNKRLPVWKIQYANHYNQRYYVETGTGSLAIRMDDRNLVEGYSFALLHKHEFMAWAGKTVKDFSTIFWATAQIMMVTVGLLLYVKMKKRKREMPSKNQVV